MARKVVKSLEIVVRISMTIKPNTSAHSTIAEIRELIKDSDIPEIKESVTVSPIKIIKEWDYA